jgi:hypothetical protein
LEFLLSARQSEDKEIREAAKEILDSPSLKRMLDEIKAEERHQLQGKVDIAKKRLQKGQKVFQYKMIFCQLANFWMKTRQAKVFR